MPRRATWPRRTRLLCARPPPDAQKQRRRCTVAVGCRACLRRANLAAGRETVAGAVAVEVVGTGVGCARDMVRCEDGLQRTVGTASPARVESSRAEWQTVRCPGRRWRGSVLGSISHSKGKIRLEVLAHNQAGRATPCESRHELGYSLDFLSAEGRVKCTTPPKSGKRDNINVRAREQEIN